MGPCLDSPTSTIATYLRDAANKGMFPSMFPGLDVECYIFRNSAITFLRAASKGMFPIMFPRLDRVYF